MSVAMSITRQSSARSISSSSGMSMSGGMQGGISISPFQSRALSVYGGAAGRGTRISQASSSLYSSAGSLGGFGETRVIGDEKMTMQNLNDRLASYLEKVRSLESANRKLELQIKEFYEKRAPSGSSDYTAFFATISGLRAQIANRFLENQRIILQIDNAQLAADDFKIKYEMEMHMRTTAEADVARLRGVRDTMTFAITELESQIEGLKEELVYMKSNHEEELRLLRVQQSGNVNVEVDSAESVDLSKVLEEMREQYETVMNKNKLQAESWFKSQSENLQTQIVSSTTEVTTSNSQLSDLKRTYQNLEISRQSAYSQIQCLQQNLDEVRSRFSLQLSHLQMTITSLETELQQLRASMQEQQSQYNILLDIKTRLEMEIAEYRRLLDGEKYEQKKVVVISKVEKVEEKKPHVERRVKTIVEEIIDGKVVSSVVDTEVETVQ